MVIVTVIRMTALNYRSCCCFQNRPHGIVVFMFKPQAYEQRRPLKSKVVLYLLCRFYSWRISACSVVAFCFCFFVFSTTLLFHQYALF
jgi:hypothetical protein